MSNLNGDAVRQLLDAGASIASVDILKVVAEPRHVYWLSNRKTGELQKHYSELPPRDVQLYTVDDIVAALKMYIEKEFAPAPIVLCGHGEITAILCDDSKGELCRACRDRLRVKMATSSQFNLLATFARSRQYLNQQSFVRMLRVDLAGTLGADTINIFRKVRFAKNEDGTGEVKTGRETMGNQINREVLGVNGEIPEILTVTIAVYEDMPTERKAIECAIDIDVDNRTFAMLPLNGELATAQQETDFTIKTQLIAALPGIPVFAGCEQTTSANSLSRPDTPLGRTGSISIISQ